MSDTKHLELHGDSWRFIRRVDGKLVKRKLGTLDLKAARRMRDHFLKYGTWDSVDAVIKDALNDRAMGVSDMRKAETLAQQSPESADLYRAVVRGQMPIQTALKRWHETKAKTFRDRTKSDHETAVGRFSQWLREQRIRIDPAIGENSPLVEPYIEHVTPAIAERYAEHLEASGVNGRTGNKHLNSLRSLWRYMKAQPNPWSGVNLEEVTAETVLERPFTDNEVKALLAGGGDDTMLAVITIGLLTGARLEEVFQLRVRDVDGDVAHIVNSKRKGAITRRPVPLHRIALAVVRAMVKGREDDGAAYVIAEGDATGWDGARSMAFSKRFATYRRKCKVDDKVEGQRRSKVNFHSARRWLANKLETTGAPELVAARILGHKVSTISYGVYSQGGSLDEMRAAIDRVSLPA